MKTKKRYSLHPAGKAALIKLLAVVLLLCFQLKTSAQTVTVLDASVAMETSPTDSTVIEGTYTVLLSDSTGVSNIEVKIGTSSGSSDVMSNVFVMDNQTGLPAGYTYARSGNKLTLGIGTYTDRSTYYCEVRVQAINGTWSQPFSFISN